MCFRSQYDWEEWFFFYYPILFIWIGLLRWETERQDSRCTRPWSSSVWSSARPAVGTGRWHSHPADKRSHQLRSKGKQLQVGDKEAITHSDEAGQEVCEYVVAHDARSQDQLLGLVVAGQLQGVEGRGRVETVGTELYDCHIHSLVYFGCSDLFAEISLTFFFFFFNSVPFLQ